MYVRERERESSKRKMLRKTIGPLKTVDKKMKSNYKLKELYREPDLGGINEICSTEMVWTCRKNGQRWRQVVDILEADRE